MSKFTKKKKKFVIAYAVQVGSQIHALSYPVRLPYYYYNIRRARQNNFAAGSLIIPSTNTVQRRRITLARVQQQTTTLLFTYGRHNLFTWISLPRRGGVFTRGYRSTSPPPILGYSRTRLFFLSFKKPITSCYF